MPGPVAAAGQGPERILPRNTLVNLKLLQEITSQTARPDDFFDLQVLDPVQVPGGIAVPAGAKAVGQVIDARKAGIFGSPAKLNITVRYLEADGRKVPMRLYRPAQGVDNTTSGTVAAIAIGVLGAFIKGGEIVLPAGSVITARVAKDSLVHPTPGQEAVPAPAAHVPASVNPPAAMADPAKGPPP